MNGNPLNLISASQVKHHRLKHGNDMHVKPDSGMHGESDNDKHAEPDNDIYIEHCNDMHGEPGNDRYVGSDDDKHGEAGNDARTRFQGDVPTYQIEPEPYKKPGPHMRTGFSESKGVSE